MRYLLLSVLSIFALTLSAQDDPLLRFPAISPDGSQIAFSYQGDIWVVSTTGGIARRLTIHESYESHPQWSPDGKQIAFQGNRYGNNDIFVVSLTGGVPLRLTYHSTNDSDPRWLGNDRLLFSSNRVYREVEWNAEVHSVAITGGTPSRQMDALGLHPNASPNGQLIAYADGECRLAREAYTGPARRDIWIYNSAQQTYQPIAQSEGMDTQPEWAGDKQLFYLSSRDGRYNIYQQTLTESGSADGQALRLTRFEDMGIRHFDVSADGNAIVFERGQHLYRMATGGKAAAEKIDIQVTADYRFDPVEQKTLSRSATEMAVSPNGKYILFGVRGELFVKPNDKEKKRAVQLTRHAYRDMNGAWLNDSTIVFISDRDGKREIYALQSGDAEQVDLYKTLKWEVKRLTNTDIPQSRMVLSPDRKQVAITRGRGQLVVADIDASGLRNEKLLLDGWDSPGGLSWSPDSKWLAYSLDDLNFNAEIYIHAADNSQKPVNVSMHPRTDSSPFWSADGSKLGFLSIRNNGDSDVWFAWLTEADWQKTQRDWEEADEDETTDKKKDEKDEENEVEAITIDLKNIHRRLAQVTRIAGNEYNLVIGTDGETFYFTTNGRGRNGSGGKSALQSIKWDGEDLTTIKEDINIRSMQMAEDGKKIYILKQDGTISTLKTDGNKMEGQSFTARMQVDHQAERQQVFDEAWAALRDGFYDPNYHGQDWNQLRAIYEPIAMSASTEQDFRSIFNFMLGQLNASHMGMFGGSPEETQRDRTGLLGISISHVSNGLRVDKIVPNSPADRSSSQLEVGDVITAVNSMPLTPTQNLYELLNGTANERTLLSVSNGTSEREVVIRPANSLRSELYEAWVEERRRLTDAYSGGKLGYIHIQGMNWPSFERFERELTASGQGKEGIVIDVRYNGGGWTTDMLMAVLNVRQHAYTVPRGAAASLEQENAKFRNNYPYGERLPLAAMTLPSIALCNEASYSNAEIFSHAYKTLGHGTLVGMPTFGAVISTGGQGLLNGNYVRMPFRAWYVKATGENMELGPAVPDVSLENAPDSKAKGKDEQLQKAVALLLEQLEK